MRVRLDGAIAETGAAAAPLHASSGHQMEIGALKPAVRGGDAETGCFRMDASTIRGDVRECYMIIVVEKSNDSLLSNF
jgi:hypothetical protein